MDWSAFITVIITSIGSSTILGFILAFIFKKWIGTRVEESIKHEYAKKLEEHKATLQEQVNKSINRIQIEHQEKLDEKLADRNLYSKFVKILPSSGSIEFIDKQDMAGSFDWKRLEQLDEFRREWKKPEYFFLDKDIDILREKLLNLSNEYLHYLSENTFPLDRNTNLSSVPDEWEIEDPDKFFKVVKFLHNLAGQIVEAYNELVTTARNKLKC